MRGLRMRQRFVRSRWTISAIWHSDSTVMAALTAFSGRCVVASATRSAPLANIITARAA